MADFEKFEYFKKSVEIDYFTYFSKCYFALNAYIKIKFEGNDREKIDEFKDDITIQNRFKELLNKDSFCSTLKDFKQKLYEAQISNDNNIISFEKVKIQTFKDKTFFDDKKSGITYTLKILPGKDENISFKCKNIKGEILQEETKCKYSELDTRLNNTKLTKAQRDTIKACFDGEIKQYTRDLTDIIENIERKRETDYGLIYKAFVEIIYQLRNALFHSEIKPTGETLKVYESAYILFKAFIFQLPTGGLNE